MTKIKYSDLKDKPNFFGVFSSDYDFTPQVPNTTLSAGVPATITLSPVPPGVNGTNANHKFYISNGTGTAEVVTMTGGAAVSGASSGTIIFTPANNHSGSWTIRSASAGVQEAVYNSDHLPVYLPRGTVTFRATVWVIPGSKIIGTGKYNPSTSTNGTYINASAVTTGYAFNYTSTVQGSPYGEVAGFVFEDFSMQCGKGGIKLNTETIPVTPYQAFLTNNVVIRNLYIWGNSSYLTDPYANTATVPALATLQTYGTGISLSFVFRARVECCEVLYFGIPLFLYGDENEIVGCGFSQSAIGCYLYSGYIAAVGGFGNKNIINHVKFAALTNIGAIWQDGDGGYGGLIVKECYFEIDSPQCQYVRQVSAGLLNFGPNNWCQSNLGSTTPPFHIQTALEVLIHNNLLLQGTVALGNIEISTTLWQTKYPNIVKVSGNNGSYFPAGGNRSYLGGATQVFFPRVPGILVGERDPLIWNPYNNPADWINGPTANAFPFIADATTGRYAFTNLDAGANVGGFSTYMFPKSRTRRTFKVQLTGRKTGTGVTFVSVSWVAAATTSLYAANLTFTATTETETLESTTFVIPIASSTSGYFTVLFVPAQALVEEFRIIEV